MSKTAIKGGPPARSAAKKPSKVKERILTDDELNELRVLLL